MSRRQVLERLLLLAFPRWFRRERGEELLAFWGAQRRERRYRGVVGGARFAVGVSLDALWRGMAVRLRGGPEAGLAGGRRGGRRSMFAMDVRYAVRSLRGAPLYALVSVVTLALGIGSTTALFAVVQGVLLRPLPYPEADELVRISRAGDGAPGAVVWLDYADWKAQAAGFAGMSAYTEDTRTFVWEDGARALHGARVTRDFFRVMGVAPLLGRTFTAEEDRLGGAEALVLSYGLWQRRFGGDPGVIGRVVRVGEGSLPVVGVMPEGFGFPYAETEFWTPLREEQLLADAGLPTGTRSLSFLEVVARLDGTDRASAERNLAALARRIDGEVGRSRVVPVVVEDLRESMVGDVRGTLVLLLGSVALVLLVACANVAGLSLSRSAAREREMAVRSALGAGRSRLLGQLLTEAVVLAGVAGVVGAGLSFYLTRLVLRLAPPGLPRLGELGMGVEEVVFASVVTLVAGLAFGLVPAVRASRASARSSLAGARGHSPGRGVMRAQGVLVSAQVAVAVVLLAAAALLGGSFARLVGVDRGFRPDGLLVASVQPSDTRFDTPEAVDGFYTTLLERLRALPGVASATSTYSPPLAGNGFNMSVAVEGAEADASSLRWTGVVVIRDDYFRTMGIPLLAGRTFEGGDRLGSPPVAIVNEAMARQLWPGESAVGQRFVWTRGIRGSAETIRGAFFPREPYTVVGVVGDVRSESLAEPAGPAFYRPHAQITWSYQYLVLRTAGDPLALVPALRDVIRSVDPTVPIEELRTMKAQVAASVATPRFRMLLLAGFAGATVLLAMMGLYAVMALAVARRTREMGIRLALGASPGGVLRSVMVSGLRLVGIGLAVGLVAAVGISRVLASMLFQVAPTDPATYAAVAGFTALVALAAAWVPARRASRVDPVRSLRAE